ncbi:hypothetical protein EDB80DRAFT_756502 [Ilyonectria destructans]|nr:hypothetical protein EDB80DRAFT_756502 [Ilyonectria destructans]
MVDIMKEAFSSRLVIETLEDSYNKLPSPPELIECILIKLLPQSLMLSPSPSSRRLVSKTDIKIITEGRVQDIMSSSTSDNKSGRERNSQKISTKTVKKLSNLSIYCTVDLYNLCYIIQVYPNFQIAALNWQTFDLGMQINRAISDGGRDFSGYMLKPVELRDIQVPPYKPELAGGKKERSVISFTIDIISAQHLIQPANLPANKSMDLYVEVEVFYASDKREKKNESTLPRDFDSPQKFQTNIVRENGVNSIFNGQFKFKSAKLSNDGENYNNRPVVAIYTAKLSNLKQGYRTLHLLNHTGDQYLFLKLFCKIKVDSVKKMMIDAPRHAQDSSGIKGLGGKTRFMI